MRTVRRENVKKAKVEKEEVEEEVERWSPFLGETQLGKKTNEILNGGTYAVISTIILVYTLFSDDVRQVFFPASADLTFTILTLLCMIYYMIEIVIYSLVQKDYFLGYYFWLDLVSTLTMAFDLVWITQFLTGGGKNAANISQISRASRAARLGTRTVKLIRLIRMVKILKQLKSASNDMATNQKKLKKAKVSKRVSKLSNLESRITSLRHLQEKIASIRNMDRNNSRRWSIIKDAGCMGAQPVPIRVSGKASMLSMSFLPYNNPDRIIDNEVSSESISHKSVSIHKALSNHQIQEVEAKRESDLVEPTNQHMVIMEQTNQEMKVGSGEMNNSNKNEMNKTKKTKKDVGASGKKQDPPSENEIFIPPESKVGARVQEDVQKNVISMIILILLSIPLLDGATWFSNTTIYDQAQYDMVFFAANYPSQYQVSANLFVNKASNTFLNPLLYFSINTGTIIDSFPDNYAQYTGNVNQILQQTRSDDISLIEGTGFTFGYDISQYNRFVSIFNITRTFFVCILLIVTTIFFSSDLQFTAIAPLEDMMETVRKIALNPLNAIREIQEKNLHMQKLEEQDEKVQLTQPQILLNTIIKISSLLAVGFGEAGTEIICQVIQDPTAMNVMIPGEKIMAIFGFCDIRNFTDATEVLEADVMVFVNQIAAICHKQVYQNLGSPNKNIGDAFLLVWKFSREDVKERCEGEDINLELIPSSRVSQMADLSVLAFVKMVSAIARSETLQKYKENKGLQSRIKDYMGVKMGFGLHVGWAIEGPIGSQYKIDASYLGPDVHMASRLEGATKVYGTGMLITDAVYDLMTENKKYLRWIDRVMSEGDKKPTNLYTVDLNTKHLFAEMGVQVDKSMTQKEKKLAKIRQAIDRRHLLESIENTQGATAELWNDEEIKIMQDLYSDKFYKEWNLGFNQYLAGTWEEALPQLNLASSLGPGGIDGPSQSLIDFMEEHKGRAPIDWKGYRGFD